MAPARTGQSFGLLRHEPGAGRDHEDVVAEHGAVGQVHPVVVDVDALDFAAVETDAVGQLSWPRPDQVSGIGHAERYEQQARLVHVLVVPIHHGDVRTFTEFAPQAVGRQGAAGTATENHDPFRHVSRLRPADPLRTGPSVTRRRNNVLMSGHEGGRPLRGDPEQPGHRVFGSLSGKLLRGLPAGGPVTKGPKDDGACAGTVTR